MASESRLAALMRRSQVRVRGVNGGVGSGWLAPGGVIITCAHIFCRCKGACKCKGEIQISYDFPMLSDDQYDAVVDTADERYYRRAKEKAGVDEIEDIVIIHPAPNDQLPKMAEPAPVSEPNDAWFDGEVTMQGYPEGGDDGVNITGYLAGPVKGRVQFDHDLKSQVVAGGFSGGAVWDKQSENVVGMVIGRDRRDGITSGYMIPIATLAKAWPQIDKEKTPENVEKEKRTSPRLYHLRCDRDEQNKEFNQNFYKTYKACPKQPQVFIVHGEEGAAHNSLVERFRYFSVHEFLKKHNNETIKPAQYNLSLACKKDFEYSRDIFLEDLADTFGGSFSGTVFTAAELCELPGAQKIPAIILSHRINADAWDQHYKRLIDWYVNDFWALPECRPDIPQFLIFLNFTYLAGEKRHFIARVLGKAKRSRQTVDEHIHQLVDKVKKPCHCFLIPELHEISRNDVKDWFDKFSIPVKVARDTKAQHHENYILIDRIDAIFGKMATSTRCMAEVEAILKQIVNEENTLFISSE